jgi:hypothetical protein
MDWTASKWLAVRASISFSPDPPPGWTARRKQFCRDLCQFFDRLQTASERLDVDGKEQCGLDGVAVEVFLRIDLEKKEVLLDRLFKYCALDFHLFTELLQILQRNFPECRLVVPSLQGYELAREMRRFLGPPEMECVYLKSDTEERLLMGKALKGISFERILEDTERHYRERGGIEKRKAVLGLGRELSMYLRGEEGEEEVLWMQVGIGLSGVGFQPSCAG